MADSEEERTTSVNISIGGKNYPLRVSPSNESAIREAGKLLARRVDFYSKKYTQKDPVDSVAMAALEVAFDYVVLQRERNEMALTEKVDEVVRRIEEALGDNK